MEFTLKTNPISCGLYWKGYLYKQSPIFKFWHKYFCELQQTELYLRKSEDSSVLDDRIPITSETRIEIIEDTKHFAISICNDKNPTILRGSNEDDILRWYISLKSASLNLNSPLTTDSFDMISVIGRGTYGKVMLVQNKQSKELFALKTIHKAQLLKSRKLSIALSELSILKQSVECPFIVDLKFAFQSATKFYIGLEFVPGGDLHNVIYGPEVTNKHSNQDLKKVILDDSTIRLFVAELAIAIDYLHRNGIIYRDLKPENVLIGSDGHLKLTDFGSSKEIPDSKTSTLCGTPEYLAPEMINKNSYSHSIDWWALGILTYELYYNDTPFYDETPQKIYSNILSKNPEFPNGTDPDVKDFIMQLLNKNPGERADFQQLKNHPFWKDFDMEKVKEKQYQSGLIPELDESNWVKYFDRIFTNETALDSIAQPVIGASTTIPGFEYNAMSSESEYSTFYSQTDETSGTRTSDDFSSEKQYTPTEMIPSALDL